ncbi:major facilitator superfamily domain-containing protein [Lipomyces arxii]|uniref:major facilitator superfamily domain-containing protein n=1 Tax=Lipomyces arxii TaxID=56418 RepID=UPI0034CD8436
MDAVAAVVEEESQVMLTDEQVMLVEAPFHQKPVADIDGVATRNGSSAIDELQPYTDDPNGVQEPMIPGVQKTENVTYIRLIVPFIFFTIAYGGSTTVKLNVILSLVCRQYFANQENLGDSSMTAWDSKETLHTFAGDIDERCQIAEVHAIASNVTLWVGLVAGVLGALSSPFLGSLSDRIGRRPIFMIALMGPFLGDLMFLIAGKWDNPMGFYLLYVSAILDGGTGSILFVVAMCHSYASDVTSPGNQRATAFSIFHGVLFIGMSIGPSLSSFLIGYTGSLIAFFYLGLTLQICFFLCVVFIAPESLSHERQMQSRSDYQHLKRVQQHKNADKSLAWNMLESINVFKPLRAFWPQDGTKVAIKRNLVILVFMDSLTAANGMGELVAIVLYAEYAFHWTSVESGYYVTSLGIGRTTCLLFLLPNAFIYLKRYIEKSDRKNGTYLPENKKFGASTVDMLVVRGSAFIAMCAHVMFISTNSPGFFLFLGFFNALAGGLLPSIEAIITKHVPRQKTGMILGAVSYTNSLSRIVGPSLFLSIYSRTVGTFPKALFFAFLASNTMIFIGTFLVKQNVTGGLMTDGSDVNNLEPDQASEGSSESDSGTLAESSSIDPGTV